MFIFFLGPDCSGKDLLMHELSRTINYKYFMSPRSPICNIVYDMIYRDVDFFDPITLNNISLIGEFLKLGAYFILIDVDSHILKKRAEEKGEKHVREVQDFDLHKKIYDQVFNDCIKRFISYENRFIKITNNGEIYPVICELRKRLNFD